MTDPQCRTFLKHTALAAALGSPAIATASHAEEIGIRAGLIDCQSHLFCEEVLALMERHSSEPVAFVKDGVRVENARESSMTCRR